MDPKSKQNHKSFRRHGGRNRNHPQRSSVRKVREELPCGICNKPIKDMLSALARPSDGVAVHFDCVLKLVGETLQVQEKKERVIYLGNGSFAVVEHKDYQNRKLKIIRRISWENTEETVAWRKKLHTNIPQ